MTFLAEVKITEVKTKREYRGRAYYSNLVLGEVFGHMIEVGLSEALTPNNLLGFVVDEVTAVPVTENSKSA